MSYRVEMRVGKSVTSLPVNTEARALLWLHDFVAANPGCTAKVYGPDGDVDRQRDRAEPPMKKRTILFVCGGIFSIILFAAGVSFPSRQWFALWGALYFGSFATELTNQLGDKK